MRKTWVTALLAGALIAAPAIADVKAGVDLWAKRDFAGAVREWRPLAERGDADAQFNLGQAYKLGRGVPADLKIAQTWYEKAAQAGHEQAQANLGLILFQGGKRAEAMPWIRKAAERGDPRAQYVYGTALFNGDIVKRDYPNAYAMMTRAAAQGLPQASGSLAEMDKHVPLADRQKGIVIARQMETGPVRTAAATAPAKTSVQAAPKIDKPAPKPQPQRTASAGPAAGGGWRVQLGAYGSEAAARGQWQQMVRSIAALSSLRPTYEKAGALTRLRAGPLAGRAAADRTCAAAKAAGKACFVVAP